MIEKEKIPVFKKNRATSITKLLAKVFIVMQFTGKWLAAIGVPEMSGVWIFWGNSFNGKTRFALMLAKYLTRFGTVIYNTLEEGARKSMQDAMKDSGMKDVAKKIVLLDREEMPDLKARLRKRKSPNIIFIDSFQYTGMSKREYLNLKKEFPTKLFIFISHSEGKQPEGKVAKFIRYDADVKGLIEGYIATLSSRYGGGVPIVISRERAINYWSEPHVESIENLTQKQSA